MTKVANRRQESKQNSAQWTPAAGERVHVGLDVHKKSIHVAIWSTRCQRIVREWVAPADYPRLVGQVEPRRSAMVGIVYEAGPTGYRLALY